MMRPSRKIRLGRSRQIKAYEAGREVEEEAVVGDFRSWTVGVVLWPSDGEEGKGRPSSIICGYVGTLNVRIKHVIWKGFDERLRGGSKMV